MKNRDKTSFHTLEIAPAGSFPNSILPVVHYPTVLKDFRNDPHRIERLFFSHDWWGSWINGIYSFDHFHSTTHEVLAVVSGKAKVRLGGPLGTEVELGLGDVIVIPAGVAHARISSSMDFVVVGAYPEGKPWDLRRGNPEELQVVLENIRAVPLPKTDPVYGYKGPLVEVWEEK
ncbi:cupin domain-containing protein [Methylacidiphilum caldifontis]|uniref:Cupin type-2 domain-containing protein n=1 Tax=Methylacidiphilum caldifontis TaxID=2795386 RepID=A0A4Y8P8Y6_9BACT|nr:cupin domain-containing protein [Methylacidiphilum caldifontis]TFE67121.1 hypothetical protein A7Q10_09885 [Methylacidiphilum caldifontis]